MKTLIIFYKLLFFIVLTKSISAQQKDYKHNSIDNEHLNYKCPPGTFYTSHPYPGNCSLYIECNNEKGTLKHCPPGYTFDNNRRICDEKNKAYCDYWNATEHDTPIDTPVHIVDKNIYCPFRLLGLYPHPFSNEKYLKCVYGRLYEKSCRSNFVYNLFKKSCEKYQENLNETLPFIQKRYLAETKIENDKSYTFLKCPANLSGNFVYPFTCSKYINCSPGGTAIGVCAPGKMFDYEQETCRPDSTLNKHVECLNENVEETITSPLGVFCKTKGFLKRYPHPDNWHKYVYCDNNKLKIQWCPRHQVFSDEDQKCIEEEEKDNKLENVVLK